MTDSVAGTPDPAMDMPRAARVARLACRSLVRATGLYSGRARLAGSSLLRWIDGAPRGLTEARLHDGSRITVDPADYIGRPVYYFGDFDPKVSAVCTRLLRAGDVAVDIGANIGSVALQMARVVGPSGTVHAFEPQPDLAARLAADARRNGFAQLVVHPVALTSEDGTATFNVAVDNCGGAAINDAGAPGYRQITVATRCANRYLDALEVRGPVRLVKIDVEGHEDIVIPMLLPWLFAIGTPPVVFESGTNDAFWSLPRVEALRASGYTLYAILRTVMRLRLRLLQQAEPIPSSVHDFIAMPEAGSGHRALRERLGPVLG